MSEQPEAKKPRRRSKKAATSVAPAADAAPIAAAANAVPGAGVTRVLFTQDIAVRWRDLDAFNHVNNSVFLTYLEETRLAWLESLPGPWLDEHSGPVLAAAHLNYRRPIGWPETVRVQLICERLGRSSITIGHRISRAQDDSVHYSDGHVVMVWVDAQSGKAAELPAAVRAAGE